MQDFWRESPYMLSIPLVLFKLLRCEKAKKISRITEFAWKNLGGLCPAHNIRGAGAALAQLKRVSSAKSLSTDGRAGKANGTKQDLFLPGNPAKSPAGHFPLPLPPRPRPGRSSIAGAPGTAHHCRSLPWPGSTPWTLPASALLYKTRATRESPSSLLSPGSAWRRSPSIPSAEAGVPVPGPLVPPHSLA